MAKVLWVCFDFPPRQSSAVYRPIRIYKYIDKSAYKIDFLTQNPKLGFARGISDETLLSEVEPPPTIYRVSNLVLHDWIFERLRRARRGKRQGDETRAGGSAKTTAPAAAASNPSQSLLSRLYRPFAMTAYFPDQFFTWGWLTALRALRLHLRERYDIVYTTSYPESGHLAGLVLRLFGVRWVADYRYGGILWVKRLLHYRKGKLREWLEVQYQKLVVRSAHRVVTQSDTIRREFVRVFGADPRRLTTIPSAYDETDFATNGQPSPFQKRDGEIHLVHTGRAYLAAPDQTTFAKELDVLGQELAERGLELVVHALGDDMLVPSARHDVTGFRYVYHGVVPHPELPAYLKAADWYLLSTITTVEGDTNTDGYLPSKMWEYLRGGRPILLYGAKDEVWEIVDEAGAAVYMGPGDGTSGLSADTLLGAIDRLEPIPEKIEQHSWKARSTSMAEIFDGLST